jgi:membrane protein
MTAQDRLHDLTGHARDRCLSLWESAGTRMPLRALHRFVAVNGKNRMVILASQAFTAVFPLLLVIASSVANSAGNNRLATSLIRRFRLEGQAATALETLFSRPPDAAGGFGVVSIVLLVFSVLSLARTLQDTFEAAWGVPARGLRGTLYGISGAALFVLEIAAVTLVASLLRGTPGGVVTAWLARVAESVLIWLLLQYVLLSGRVPWRRLVPGAVLAGAGQVVITACSAIYMPKLIAANSARYGVIGVALALITWLLVIAVAIVAGAVAGAELARQPPLGPGRREATR